MKETGDRRPMVVLSTASAYKFPAAVLSALGITAAGDEFMQMQQLRDHTGVPIPAKLAALQEMPERHTAVIEKESMLSFVLNR